MDNMTIGQLAKRTELNVESIRYYERRGLIPQPRRSEAGYRLYSRGDVARIYFIKRAKKLGFSLSGISELLSLRVDPECTCGMVRTRAREKIADIESKIETLQDMKRALVKLTASCRGTGPTSECPILDFLQPQADEAENEEHGV